MKDLRGIKIAVVGATEDTGKFGHKIYRDMINGGLNVCGVNPKGGTLLEKAVYKSVLEIKEAPDLVVTVVRPDVTLKILDECIIKGVKEIWMQPGSESSEAILKAKEKGIKAHYYSCIMIESGLW